VILIISPSKSSHFSLAKEDYDLIQSSHTGGPPQYGLYYKLPHDGYRGLGRLDSLMKPSQITRS
jgi:hypothetical protein